MSEKFNLKWNDFSSNASKSFGSFRNESYLHDVTLVSDDFKHVPAHKLVLSASSEYFRNILQQTKQAQPLICLDGVNSFDLRNVLDYVYDGEVKILQENLDHFLVIANKLRLEGLIGGEEENFDDNNITEIEKPEKCVEVAHVANPKVQMQRKPIQRRERVVDGTLALNESFSDRAARLDESIVDNGDGTLSCTVCRKRTNPNSKSIFSVERNNLRNHVETHLDGISYSCNICEKTFRSKNSLNCHKSVFHKQ